MELREEEVRIAFIRAFISAANHVLIKEWIHFNNKH